MHCLSALVICFHYRLSRRKQTVDTSSSARETTTSSKTFARRVSFYSMQITNPETQCEIYL